MIQIDDISLAFGQQVIFNNSSISIDPFQKIGLVGRNGSGKSTFLNVLVGKQALDDGTISIPKDFTVAFMSQDMVLVSDKSIINEALNAFSGLGNHISELHKLEQQPNHDKDHDIHEQIAHLHHVLYEMEYEKKRIEAERMLEGLGFSKQQLDQPVSSLSVGWKMRLVLAQLLLQKADFYLFDEPTNHLDLVAKDWFAKFLQTAPFGFILVSHDEYFLNNTCSHICEIENGDLTCFNGGYNKYLVQKEANETVLEKKYEEQQKFIKRQQATIDRFRAKSSKARMAQSMQKSLEKIEKIELSHQQKSVRLSLIEPKQSGKVVLDAKNLAFSYKNKPIFEHVTFKIMRGEKVAIVAPNGTGKSTLLNVIMGKLTPQAGEVSFGYNVVPAFFEQDQNKSLNGNNTIIEEVESACQNVQARARARSLLGSFLFPGDDIYKKISVLSGGEKNRVAMVKIFLQDANFLLLDEPTNHLDIISKRILLDALKQYKGTLLFVSHDRTFLNNLATDILDLTEHGVHSYKGNYDDFLYYTKSSSQSFAKKEKKDQNKSSSSCKKKSAHDYEERKQLRNVESAIKKHEKKIAEISEQFSNLEYGSDTFVKESQKLQKHQQELAKANELWEQLMKKLED